MKRFSILLLLNFLIAQAGFSQITANDVGLKSISTKMWATEGESLQISGILSNRGTQVLNQVTVNWSANGGDTHAWTMDNLSLIKSRDTSFIHPAALVVEGSEDIELKVWVSDPNGEADEQSRNDTLTKTIQVITEFPERHILLEEFTGAWCGWCPRGPITYRDQILPQFPNVILAALHNGDDMVTTNGNTVVSAYASGFPSGMIDRKAIGDYPVALGTGDWIPVLRQMDREFTPASIEIYNYYWTDTYEWKIDVVVDFIMDYTADMRVNCIILEDSVHGSGSGYNQSNYYNTMTDYPELNGAGNPIVGYRHNHVVRDMLGGAWGASGVIPKNAKRGERYIFSRTIKPQQGWNLKNIRLVGVLQVYNSSSAQRPVLNAAETTFNLATGSSLEELPTHISLYPNPALDAAVIEISSTVNDQVNIEISTVSGQVMSRQTKLVSVGSTLVPLQTNSWNPGLYLVRVTTREGQHTLRLVKN